MLFFISFFMVFVSSYLTASVFSIKDENSNPKSVSAILFTLITMFAQVVLTFEILSLFSAISVPAVLILNFIFFAGSIFLWIKKGKPLYVPKFKHTLKKIWKCLKKDKILMIMAFGFLFMVLYTIAIDVYLPVTGADALAYHLNRASYWLHQGSLNHFTISDDRNLVMPINSEILYLWNLLFFKNDYGIYLISFAGFVTSLFSVYNILEFFGFSERRKLWSVLILSSMASVFAQASSSETDVFLAGLVLSSILLYLYSLKNKNLALIFFSSLAYALAIGTKTPAIIAFPGVFLLLGYFTYKFNKDNEKVDSKAEFFKPLAIFLGFLILNFIIFSSYNYILNFLQFKNPLGSESARVIHGFRGGFKAFVANYIRYMFMLFDFSGFRYSDYVGEHITNARQALLTFLHIPADLGVEMPDNNVINNRLLNVKMGTGLLGFLLFLPGLITALVLGFFKKTGKKVKSLTPFAWMFFINVGCMSFSIAYMVFSIRFLTFLIILSSPVLALTYMKKTNILKLLILFFVMSYFVVIATNLSGRQLTDILSAAVRSKSVTEARELIRQSIYIGFEGKRQFSFITDFIKTTPKGTNIAIFPSITEMYPIDMLNSQGWNITTLLPEKADKYDLSKYDYIITTDKILLSTVLLTDTKHAKIEYKINKDENAYYPEYKPFSCVYEKHGRGFYHPSQKGTKIINSRCVIDIPFFEEKGFYALKAYNLVSPDQKDNHFTTIYKKNDN